jgi:hypothetical protein
MNKKRRKHDDVHYPMCGKGAKALKGEPSGSIARLIVPEKPKSCDKHGLVIKHEGMCSLCLQEKR